MSISISKYRVCNQILIQKSTFCKYVLMINSFGRRTKPLFSKNNFHNLLKVKRMIHIGLKRFIFFRKMIGSGNDTHNGLGHYKNQTPQYCLDILVLLHMQQLFLIWSETWTQSQDRNLEEDNNSKSPNFPTDN